MELRLASYSVQPGDKTRNLSRTSRSTWALRFGIVVSTCTHLRLLPLDASVAAPMIVGGV